MRSGTEGAETHGADVQAASVPAAHAEGGWGSPGAARLAAQGNLPCRVQAGCGLLCPDQLCLWMLRGDPEALSSSVTRMRACACHSPCSHWSARDAVSNRGDVEPVHSRCSSGCASCARCSVEVVWQLPTRTQQLRRATSHCQCCTCLHRLLVLGCESVHQRTCTCSARAHSRQMRLTQLTGESHARRRRVVNDGGADATPVP